jgi:hypothetical protein
VAGLHLMTDIGRDRKSYRDSRFAELFIHDPIREKRADSLA